LWLREEENRGRWAESRGLWAVDGACGGGGGRRRVIGVPEPLPVGAVSDRELKRLPATELP
jgi:hypothetical protein